MFIQHQPNLSMYSNWLVKVNPNEFHPSGMTPLDSFGAYSSSCRDTVFGIFSVAKPNSFAPLGKKVNDGEVILFIKV
jgi:hypothetical protein